MNDEEPMESDDNVADNYGATRSVTVGLEETPSVNGNTPMESASS